MPPRLPAILERPRLIESLEKNRDKRLILILGQAAQGKTTLAASCVKRSEIPSAWINLNRDDSEPVDLFYSMVHSFQHVLMDTDFSSLLSYPSMGMGPRLEIPLYREWTNVIFEQISFPIQIVFDGLDRLTVNAPSFQFLKLLIEEAPQHVHLLILSREEPPFEIQGLKVKQGAYVLTNEDLAFTQDEIKAFFQELRGMSFGPGQLKKVHQFTEGWIGGLLLLSETLNRFPEDTREKYLRESIPDRFKGAVFQYFGEEILSSLPGPTQRFLIRSSIFKIIEPGLAKDLLGMEESEEILKEHAKKNLFVQSNYEDKKGWIFRYHQLFRDFLQFKFRSEIGEEERRSLFLKAGAIYEQRGHLEESVRHYLKAKAYDRAASVIEQIGMDLLNTGRGVDLAQLLEALPEDLIQGNPWLLFYLSMNRRFTGVGKNIESFQKAHNLFEQQKDVRGCLLSLSYLIEATFFKGDDSIPISILIEQGETLLESLKSDLYPHERAILWSQIGFGYALRGYSPRKGFQACQNAYLISTNLDDIPLQLNALINAVLALSFLGEFTLADEFRNKIDKLMGKCAYDELRVLHLVHNSQLYVCRGDLKKAKNSIQMAYKGIEEHGLIYLNPSALFYDLWARAYLKEGVEAEEIGNRLFVLASSLGNTYSKGVTSLLLGCKSYHEGDVKKAKERIERARKILSSPKTRAEIHLYFAKVGMGLIHYHLQEETIVENEVQGALNYAIDTTNYLIMVDAHFAMALIKHKQDRNEESATHLREGFKVAEERRYYHFICLNREDLVQVCILALELQVKDAIDYAANLLSTHLSPEAGPELERLCKHSNRKIRIKAREIRMTIHRATVPRLRIETLGGFGVFRGDSPMKESEWKRSQPRNLFKLILAHGAKKIPKDLLMDDLLPEGDLGAVDKNFRIILHRLRKSLEPGMVKEFGSSYIHLKDNRVFLDTDLCEVDILKFYAFIEKGEAKENEGDIKAARQLYDHAIDLYKGDLLPEDLYVM